MIPVLQIRGPRPGEVMFSRSLREWLGLAVFTCTPLHLSCLMLSLALYLALIQILGTHSDQPRFCAEEGQGLAVLATAP